jgi:hypothetical protein
VAVLNVWSVSAQCKAYALYADDWQWFRAFFGIGMIKKLQRPRHWRRQCQKVPKLIALTQLEKRAEVQ